MKLGLYWSYATRSLWRGGQRTLLAIFCVVVGIMAIVSLQLVGQSINNSLTGNVRDSNGGDLSVTSPVIALRADQLNVFAQLKNQGKITQYTAVSGHTGQSDAKDGTTQYYELNAVDPKVYPLAGAPTFVAPSGATLKSVLTGDNIALTKNLADTLGVKVGDSITITSDDGRVVNGVAAGIIASANNFNSNQALIAESSYAAITSSSGLPVTYSAIYVNVPGHTNANANAVKKDITSQLSTANVTTTQDALQNREQQVQNIRYFLEVVGLLSLLIGGVGIVNTMQVLLRRRQIEIAVLKTSGYQRSDLYALFGLEAGLLGLVGGVIGSAAGLGVSLLVRNLVVQRFFIDLPVTIDPGIIASGAIIGVATALIFGLMPIVQAAQIRPLAVIRGVSEAGSGVGWFLQVVLFVLLAVLFYVLAAIILGNWGLAAIVIVGAGVVLGLLYGIFFVLTLIVSHWPMPDGFSWWQALLGLILIAGGAALIYFAQAYSLGALAVVLGLLFLVPQFLRRTAKANTRMALRNLGRDSGRSVTTMVALFVGVFGIGLILALGQNIKTEINAALSSQLKYNSFVIAGAKDKPAVDAEVAKVKGLKSAPQVNSIAQSVPVAINGVPIDKVLANVPSRPSGGSIGKTGAEFFLSGVQGYDLSKGPISGVTLVPGKGGDTGRLLNASDANTLNVLMPSTAALAPLNLKPGDTITIANAFAAQGGSGTGATGTGASGTGGSGAQPPAAQYMTLHVVGFYTGSVTTFAPILADNSVVEKLAQGQQFYVYSLEFDPTQADQQLHTIAHAVKGVQTFSVVDLTIAINSLLNNLIIVLTAIASLAMVAGVIIIANAVGLAMLERRREIGILKSVGYTSANVMNGVLVENGMIGFVGAGVAMLIVTIANFILDRAVFSLNFGDNPGITLGIIAATILICVAVAIAVAWSATRVRPLEVLRYE